MEKPRSRLDSVPASEAPEPVAAAPPTTMRAVALTAIGGPQHLEEIEVPAPIVGDGEVLIEVRTVGANHQDVFTMSGRANTRDSTALPHILGIDPAGLVAAVGRDVEGFAPGDRVVVKPAIACGSCRFCVAGHDDACRSLQNIGVHRPGGFAEYVSVPAQNVFRIPDALGFAEATAIAHSFPVALLMLRERAAVGPDDIVLVTSASGAIGRASVELAKNLGATVIAAAGSAERAEHGGAVGADMVIDYGSTPDFAPMVRERFPDGVSVYVESAGNPQVWDAALKTLGRKGRAVVCGAHAGPIVELDLTWLFRFRASILGTSGSSLETVRDVMELAAEGKITPNVDSVRPLREARTAFARLTGRRNRGKVVMRVGPEHES